MVLVLPTASQQGHVVLPPAGAAEYDGASILDTPCDCWLTDRGLLL